MDFTALPDWRPTRLDSAYWQKPGRTRVTVSGSFTRHQSSLLATMEDMHRHDVAVLSPNSGEIDGIDKGFAYLKGDPSRDKKWTEDRHIEALRHSDFMWIINPDGYLGLSTAFEMGFARALGVPIFGASKLDHDPLGKYAMPMPRWQDARAKATPRRVRGGPPLLISPRDSINELQTVVLSMQAVVSNAAETLHPGQAEYLRRLAARARQLLGESGK
jgi:nucleoside 2-deoxyribosyltransferase